MKKITHILAIAVIASALSGTMSSCSKKVANQNKRKFKAWGMFSQDVTTPERNAPQH